MCSSDLVVSACLEKFADILQRSERYCQRKTRITDISHLTIGYRSVLEATSNPIFLSQIAVGKYELFVEIGGIRLEPALTTRHIEGRIEVDVPVLQGIEHLGKEVEHSHLRTDFWQFSLVDSTDTVPIDAFFFEETVLTVEYLPQCVEIGFGAEVSDMSFAARKGYKRHHDKD